MNFVEKIKPKIERLETDFSFIKNDIQIRIHELYYQGLITEKEATALLKNSMEIDSFTAFDEFYKNLSKEDFFKIDNYEKEQEEIRRIKRIRELIETDIIKDGIYSWEKTFIEVIKYISGFDIMSSNKDVIKGLLANFLERVLLSYKENNTSFEELKEDILSFFEENKNSLPGFLTSSYGKELGKRQPGFLESTEETIKRFIYAEKFKEYLKSEIKGMIIGGSLSYGPFYNVRKKLDETGSSDVDLIILVDNEFFDKKVTKFLNIDFFTTLEKESFLERISKFKILREAGVADIISQKFFIKDGGFDFSLHVFDQIFFKRMVGGEFRNNLKKSKDGIFKIKDFKAESFTHKTCHLNSFSGKEIEVGTQEKKIDGGVITSLPNYVIQQGEFYPGIYQNLISPKFSVFYDPKGNITKQVKLFESTMKERLGEEQKNNPDNKLYKSHNRYKLFSPILTDLLKKT